MKKFARIRFAQRLLIFVLTAPFAGVALAGHTTDGDELQTDLTVYLWLPSLDGDLKYEGNGGSSSIDAGDILGALQMGFMGALEFRKEKWSVLLDAIYLDLQDEKSSGVGLPGGGELKTKVDLQLSGWQLGVYGGYQLYSSERARLDLFGGARHLSLDTKADLEISGPLPPGLPGKKLSRSANIWDAVIGLRGRAELGDNWFVPYHADIGAGNSELTWQAMAGVGYATNWGELVLVYRQLEWDEGDDKLLQGLSFGGPAVAVKYSF